MTTPFYTEFIWGVKVMTTGLSVFHTISKCSAQSGDGDKKSHDMMLSWFQDRGAAGQHLWPVAACLTEKTHCTMLCMLVRVNPYYTDVVCTWLLWGLAWASKLCLKFAVWIYNFTWKRLNFVSLEFNLSSLWTKKFYTIILDNTMHLPLNLPSHISSLLPFRIRWCVQCCWISQIF